MLGPMVVDESRPDRASNCKHSLECKFVLKGGVWSLDLGVSLFFCCVFFGGWSLLQAGCKV